MKFDAATLDIDFRTFGVEKIKRLETTGTGVNIFQFLIPNGIEVKSTFGGIKIHFLYH